MNADAMRERTIQANKEMEQRRIEQQEKLRQQAQACHPITLHRCLSEIEQHASVGRYMMTFTSPAVGHPYLISDLKEMGFSVTTRPESTFAGRALLNDLVISWEPKEGEGCVSTASSDNLASEERSRRTASAMVKLCVFTTVALVLALYLLSR